MRRQIHPGAWVTVGDQLKGHGGAMRYTHTRADCRLVA